MFRASPRPLSGAYNCTRSLWFNRWSVAVGALLVVVWQITTSVVGRGLADHDQQRYGRCSPTVKREAPSAVVRS